MNSRKVKFDIVRDSGNVGIQKQGVLNTFVDSLGPNHELLRKIETFTAKSNLGPRETEFEINVWTLPHPNDATPLALCMHGHGRGLGAALETGLAALELGQGGGQIITCLSGAADLGPGSGDGVCLFTLHILLFVLPPNLLPLGCEGNSFVDPRWNPYVRG